MEEYRRKEREKNALLVAKVKDQITAESSESEDEGKKARHDIVVRSDDKTAGGVQHFFKSSKKNPTMFPYFEDKIKFDEYGEIIRPEDYVIAEEDHEMTDYSEEKPKWEEEVFTFEVFYKLVPQLNCLFFSRKQSVLLNASLRRPHYRLTPVFCTSISKEDLMENLLRN